MLWALNTLGNLRVAVPVSDCGAEDPASVTLVVEPPHGGDQQQLNAGSKTVVQIKARSGGGRWSLQELVTEVLPDLYRAVDLAMPSARYQFVTEGRRGDWREAETFFHSLRDRQPGDGPLGQLDDTTPVRFRKSTPSDGTKKTPFWDTNPYTERTLFLRIARHLVGLPVTRSDQEGTVHRKLWHLLANFEFVEARAYHALEQEIKGWLRDVVPAVEQVEEHFARILFDLEKAAIQGGEVIHADEFFAKHNLCRIRLSDTATICDLTHAHLSRHIANRRLDLSRDVRSKFTEAVLAKWDSAGPVLIISGESGQGKSWLGLSLLQEAARRLDIVAAIEFKRSHAESIRWAERVLWNDILGRESTVALGRIHLELTRKWQGQERRKFRLLIDGIDSQDEARQLLQERWEDWGFRFAMTCYPDIADAIAQATPEPRYTIIKVPDFSSEELRDFLMFQNAADWMLVPQDVRDTLRRPLLAHIYYEIAGGAGWRPTTEYEVCDEFWQCRLRNTADVANLRAAALSLISGSPYPWSIEQLCTVFCDAQCPERLVRCGWLRCEDDGRYSVWHPRLLNWAVAEAIVFNVRQGRLKVDAIGRYLGDIFFSRATHPSCFLGYVPRDVLWIATHASPPMTEFSVSVLRALESR
jgi:hypothetical protein